MTGIKTRDFSYFRALIFHWEKRGDHEYLWEGKSQKGTGALSICTLRSPCLVPSPLRMLAQAVGGGQWVLEG